MRRARAHRNALLVAACWLTFAALPSTAHADGLDDFLAARDGYLAGEYPAAITRFELLLGQGAVGLAPELRERARSYYAASLYSVGQRDAAVAQFETLLRERPAAQINPEQFSQVVVQLFFRTRERLADELAGLRRAQEAARVEAERAERVFALTLREFLTNERVVLRTPAWSAPLPLGISQFYGGDAAAGQAFLWTGVGLGLFAGGVTISHYIASQPYELDPTRTGIHCEESSVCTLRAIRVVAWSVFGAAVVSGIVHGIATYRPERVQTRPRPVPPGLERLRNSIAPSASFSPEGASVGLRLAF